jgi:hypothetical protein
MRLPRSFAAAGLIAALPLFTAATFLTASGQSSNGVQTKTVVTVLPKHSEPVPPITPKDLEIRVNGKTVQADSVVPLRGDRGGLELVILIDSGARTSLGRQMGEISKFVQSLPPTTEVAIAYMMNGRAIFQQPFTTDKNLALHALHLPGGVPGSSASPYFCISDLARNWPSRNLNNRREVLAITDGIDPYEVRFDPEDPYVRAAIHDSIRAGVIVDALYWHDMGLASRIGFLATGGQSLLMLMTGDTGGRLYYQGLGNPVSFTPFLNDLGKRLENQYELGFAVPGKSKPELEPLKVKLEKPGVKLDAPRLVLVPGEAR